MGAPGALSAAPKAPFPRRAREIPPKAGISRVFIKGKHMKMFRFKFDQNLNTNEGFYFFEGQGGGRKKGTSISKFYTQLLSVNI